MKLCFIFCDLPLFAYPVHWGISHSLTFLLSDIFIVSLFKITNNITVYFSDVFIYVGSDKFHFGA